MIKRNLPAWRDNKTKVRVFRPDENVIPGNEQHLAFITNFPRRLYDWGQAARIIHELQNAIEWSNYVDDITVDDIRKAKGLFTDALKLDGIFGDETWLWGTMMRGTVIKNGLRAANLLLGGEPYDEDDVRSVGFRGRTITCSATP